MKLVPNHSETHSAQTLANKHCFRARRKNHSVAGICNRQQNSTNRKIEKMIMFRICPRTKPRDFQLDLMKNEDEFEERR